MDLSFHNENWVERLQKLRPNYENTIIVSGLYLTNSDLRNALLLHRQRGNVATLLAIRGLKFQVGLVNFESDDIISEFKEKPIDKSQLVNSRLLILNHGDPKVKAIINQLSNEPTESSRALSEGKEDCQNLNFENQLIQHLISQKLLKTIELTGTNDEPWFLDLSKIETWIKLDSQEFIKNFSHLFNQELVRLIS